MTPHAAAFGRAMIESAMRREARADGARVCGALSGNGFMTVLPPAVHAGFSIRTTGLYREDLQ